MAEFGKFSEITFIDGTSPPINADNLNELERVIALTDQELSRSKSICFNELKDYFFERNTKEFLHFQNYTDWTNSYPSNGSLSDEEDDQLIGNHALKLEVIHADASWLSIEQTISSVDLTIFQDGSSSTDDDIIEFYFYVSDHTKFTNLEFRLGDDFSNSYLFQATGNFSTGWNSLFPTKSDFTTIGTPAGWDDITYVRVAPRIDSGNVGEYLYFQNISLARQDSVYSGYLNCFQKYVGSVTGWTNIFTNQADTCLLYRDHQDFIEKIGMMKIDGEADNWETEIYPEVLEFISKFEFYCKYAGESASITWRVDSNNYAEVYISSNTFYLDVNEASSLTQTSKALDNNLIKNERFYIYFEKENDTFRAILKKDGEQITILEYETSISSDSDGNVYIGQHTANSYSFLTDFIIGHKPINYLSRELLPRLVLMQANQSFSDNTTANISGLVCNLSPNSYYQVDIFLVVTQTSTGANVKISWELTDCVNQTQRVVLGPPTTSTNALDSNVVLTEYAPSTSVQYVVNVNTETYIKESMVILSAYNGGKVQIKAAQVVTNGSHPTVISSRSWMKITPLDASAHNNI